jgi:hypothetical protein
LSAKPGREPSADRNKVVITPPPTGESDIEFTVPNPIPNHCSIGKSQPVKFAVRTKELALCRQLLTHSRNPRGASPN